MYVYYTIEQNVINITIEKLALLALQILLRMYLKKIIKRSFWLISSEFWRL